MNLNEEKKAQDNSIAACLASILVLGLVFAVVILPVTSLTYVPGNYALVLSNLYPQNFFSLVIASSFVLLAFSIINMPAAKTFGKVFWVYFLFLSSWAVILFGLTLIIIRW